MRRIVILSLIVLAALLPGNVRAQTGTPTPTPIPPPGGGAGKLLYVTKTTDGTEVFSINVDGTEKSQLTKSRNPKFYPSWSPDGSQIVYEEIVGSLNAVYLKKPDLKAAPTDLVHGNYPRWTPDGKQIILSIDGGGTSIYVVNVNGTGTPQVVVRAKTAKDSRFYPSMGGPDGKSIAYAGKTGTGGTYEIYVTGISERLGAVSGNNFNDRYPVWSPDGTSIAHSNDKGEICLIEISPITRTITGSKCFPNYIADNSCPSWSPDSTQIAFVSYLYEEYKYYVMNRDGTNVHPLIDDPAFIYKQSNGFIRCSPVGWH